MGSMVFRLLPVRFRGAPCATRIPRILTEEIGNMGAIALILAVCVLGFGMSFSGAVVGFLVLVWLAIVSQS